MMKVYTASTAELDDIELAIAELGVQIPTEDLLQHTIGIISCNLEFIKSGMIKALYQFLSFPIAGFTTNASAVNHSGGAFHLSLTVLTSDTVNFSVGVSAPLTKENAEVELAKLYKDLEGKLTGKAGMLFSFAPALFDVNGDDVVQHLDKASGSLPNFGALALDFTTEIRSPMTILNEEAYGNRLVLVVFSDELKVAFNVLSINKDKIMPQNALITKAEGSVLKEINNIPVLTYLESIGLASRGEITGINAIPLVMDYGDGTQPVVRVVLAIDGNNVLCGGEVRENATLSVGSIDHEDVIASASEMVAESSKGKHTLMISCIGRTLALGFDHMGEINRVIEDCGSNSFLFSYSAGEICPMPTPDGGFVNRFHNCTLISCVFLDG